MRDSSGIGRVHRAENGQKSGRRRANVLPLRVNGHVVNRSKGSVTVDLDGSVVHTPRGSAQREPRPPRARKAITA